MMLRLALVSVAASLGIQPPDVEQVRSWAGGVQVWTANQLAAWDSRMPAGEGAFLADAEVAAEEAGSQVVDADTTSGPTPDRPAVADASFAAVVERFAADFEADQASRSGLLPVAFQADAASDDLDPGAAFAMSKQAEGWKPSNPVVADPEGQSVDGTTADAGRLATAVRLTREALTAWAGLLHGPAVVALTR